MNIANYNNIVVAIIIFKKNWIKKNSLKNWIYLGKVVLFGISKDHNKYYPQFCLNFGDDD